MMTLAKPLEIVLLLTMLSLIPSLLIVMTSFTRIVIVLSFLRTALGLQQTPPNMVLMSLALMLTFYTMLPVGQQIYQQSYLPYQNKILSEQKAIESASIPIKRFMLKQTHEDELKLMFHLGKIPLPKTAKDVSLNQLVPAFMLSELQTAFQIGFIIFLPFLLIDLVVSGILMGLGMMMVPPMSISLPIKILLFTLIHGWDLITTALISSFVN